MPNHKCANGCREVGEECCANGYREVGEECADACTPPITNGPEIDYVQALMMWSNATIKEVGGTAEEPMQQLTVFGAMAMGAGLELQGVHGGSPFPTARRERIADWLERWAAGLRSTP